MATRLGVLAPALGARAFMYYSPDNAAQELSAIAGAMTLRPQGTGDLGRRMGAIVAALAAEGFAHVVLLLAVDAPHAELFASIPWSTHLVYETTVSRARSSGLTVCELPGWYDADTADDLARLRLEYSSGTSAHIPHTWKALKIFLRKGARPSTNATLK